MFSKISNFFAKTSGKTDNPVRGDKIVSSVEEYWGNHTVNARLFETPEESLWYLCWRNEQYPFFKELTYKHLDVNDKVALDYGCGPGNDLVYLMEKTSARKIIGMDVSRKALDLAQHRINLHSPQKNRVELIPISDLDPSLPLDDASIDFIFCNGVLMHVSRPIDILKEFYRVLKPKGQARLMLYNADSLWKHLYVGYQKLALGQPMTIICPSDTYYEENQNMHYSLNEAFSRATDGVHCPRADNYRAENFLEITKSVGFESEFLGAYFAQFELDVFECHKDSLNQLPYGHKLNNESREFLQHLHMDSYGYPQYLGRNAGIGGVYSLRKP